MKGTISGNGDLNEINQSFVPICYSLVLLNSEGGRAMTNQEKKRIIELRNNGVGYGTIAKELGVSKNAISAFCRRLNVETSDEAAVGVCKNCGAVIINTPKHKIKVFCSNQCRMQWWKIHKEELNHKVVNKAVCPSCNKEFIYNGNRKQRYCSRSCYLNSFKRGGKSND